MDCAEATSLFSSNRLREAIRIIRTHSYISISFYATFSLFFDYVIIIPDTLNFDEVRHSDIRENIGMTIDPLTIDFLPSLYRRRPCLMSLVACLFP